MKIIPIVTSGKSVILSLLTIIKALLYIFSLRSRDLFPYCVSASLVGWQHFSYTPWNFDISCGFGWYEDVVKYFFYILHPESPAPIWKLAPKSGYFRIVWLNVPKIVPKDPNKFKMMIHTSFWASKPDFGLNFKWALGFLGAKYQKSIWLRLHTIQIHNLY